VSPLFRRTPRVRAEMALHGPRRAAAQLHPRPGRWPEHERADRLAIGLGTLALAARFTTPNRWEPFRATLAPLAEGIASSGSGALPGDLVWLDALGPVGRLAVVPWEGPGRLGVESDLIDSPAGPVPRLRVRPKEAGPGLEIAALALVVALAVDVAEDRLALALGIEGLLAWHRDSDRLAPPRDALMFALSHAGGRLREAGRSLPPGL
jgi:hypothetical protein